MKLCELLKMCGEHSSVTTLSPGTVVFLEFLIIVLFIAWVGRMVWKKDRKGIRDVIGAAIAIVLFEVMIDPLIYNTGFFSWSYFFHDVTFILTFGWILIVSFSVRMVDKVFARLSEPKRFLLYLCLIDMFVVVIEVFLVKSGLRSYSASLANSRYGIYVPFTPVPIGVVFVIPACFALVISFTKYLEKIAWKVRP